jgi:hypothetical protein
MIIGLTGGVRWSCGGKKPSRLCRLMCGKALPFLGTLPLVLRLRLVVCALGFRPARDEMSIEQGTLYHSSPL